MLLGLQRRYMRSTIFGSSGLTNSIHPFVEQGAKTTIVPARRIGKL